MPTKTKPIDIEELSKIEMRNDGKDSQRFEAMLRQVVSVPRSEILKREAAEKNASKSEPKKARS